MSIWDWFSGRFHRRKLTLNDPSGWGEIWGYTADGSPVTKQTVIALSTAWACITLRSQTIGTLPCGVYRQGKNGGTPTRDREHPLDRIVSTAPNQEFTAARFWESVVASLDIHGNAYLEKAIGTGDRVVGLNYCDPATMDAQRKNGRMEYWFTDPATRNRRQIPVARMIHIRQRSLGGDLGLSTIAAGARSFGLARDTNTAARSTFGNGLKPGGFFTTDRVLEQEQRDDFRKRFIEEPAAEGPSKAGWIGLLEGGFKWTEIRIRPDDAQMLESRRFDIEEVCRWFGTPPIMVGHASEGQTMWGSGVSELQNQFVVTAVNPMAINIEGELGRCLLTPAEQAQGVFFRFNIDAMLRATPKERADHLSTMVDHGLMTRNEARAKENLPPEPGGDVLTVQGQFVRLEDVGKAPSTQAMSPARPGAPANDDAEGDEDERATP